MYVYECMYRRYALVNHNIAHPLMYISYLFISKGIIIVLSVALAVGVISFLAAGMLILGVMRVRSSLHAHIHRHIYLSQLVALLISFTPIQERHLMLLPWLINSGVEIVFSIILALVGTIVSPFESGSVLGLLVLGESSHFNRKRKIKANDTRIKLMHSHFMKPHTFIRTNNIFIYLIYICMYVHI